VRATININDGLLAELKELAHARRGPLREVVDTTLRLGLAAAPAAIKPPKLPAFPVGI